MTQEDKDLVLKDMCPRVPYKLRLWIKMYEGKPDYFIKSHNILSSINYTKAVSPQITIDGALFDIEGPEYSHGEQYIKPYLRPMSSMTEEEKKKVCSLNGISLIELNERLKWNMYEKVYTIETFDLFNALHIDYRNLIPKGLAIAVTEDNNPYKE